MNIIKERPILFSGPMVRAILDDRKIKSRRLSGLEEVNKNPDLWTFQKMATLDWMTKRQYKGRHGAYFESEKIEPRTLSICPQVCPYGKPGDRLWVRETHTFEYWDLELYDSAPAMTDRPIFHHGTDPMDEYDSEHWLIPHYRATDPTPELFYEDDPSDYGGPKCKWRPSIFMPRWASRIDLEIVNISVERLKSITLADVLAEGIQLTQDGYFLGPLAGTPDFPWNRPELAYAALWNHLNAKRGMGWDFNPWAWVVHFKRLEKS